MKEFWIMHHIISDGTKTALEDDEIPLSYIPGYINSQGTPQPAEIIGLIPIEKQKDRRYI